MKYRVFAWKKNGASMRGTQLLTDIDEAIILAKKVAAHYHCMTRVERVAE